MTSDAAARPWAIKAEHLGKTYQLGERMRLGAGLTRRLRGQAIHQRPLEAVQDLNFEIERGECCGIIGTNGSGKSTFLQILSRTVIPTKGSLFVRGSVLPMLAVGAGFHAELTGCENVLLQGGILGVPRRIAFERMEEIMVFAGLQRHTDTPLKRYSTGMAARLSFAIGMRFPADIYIFDEVLAVVDGAFRSRCLAEIENMVGSGPTVLFVSHDLDQVARLCRSTIWLEQGRLRAIGETQDVIAAYRAGVPEQVRGRAANSGSAEYGAAAAND
jgi:ABC-type polysaccharide/polyol phosphate transport system ATPase subunit